jgi:hypothetical protein
MINSTALFRLFDSDQSGSISFPEIVTGLSQLCGQSADDRLRLLFGMYDQDGDGYVTKREMIDMVASLQSLHYDQGAAGGTSSQAMPLPGGMDVQQFVDSIFQHAIENPSTPVFAKKRSGSEPTVPATATATATASTIASITPSVSTAASASAFASASASASAASEGKEGQRGVSMRVTSTQAMRVSSVLCDRLSFRNWERAVRAFPFLTSCFDASNFALSDTKEMHLLKPPQWVSDSARPVCSRPECARPFTVVRRRHHCRHCGEVFCARCSDYRIGIPQFEMDKPVRVCETCLIHLKEVLCERAGYMWKRGAINSTSWKRRWFVLQDSTLEYYMTHTQMELRGTIELERDCVVLKAGGTPRANGAKGAKGAKAGAGSGGGSGGSGGSGSLSLEFDLRATGGRMYHLRAGSASQLESWLKAIDKTYKVAVAFRRKQSTQKSTSSGSLLGGGAGSAGGAGGAGGVRGAGGGS